MHDNDSPGASPTFLWESIFWSLISAAVLLTNRYILVEQNWHFPARLLLLQAPFALGVLLIRTRLNASSLRPAWDWATLPWTSILGCCTAATSMISLMQALLHVPNLPGLAMLFIVAWLVHDILAHSCSTDSTFNRPKTRLLLLIITSAVLIYEDYRLTVNGILFSLSAAICSGVGRYLLCLPATSPGLSCTSYASVATLTFCVLCAVSLIVTYLYEYGQRSAQPLSAHAPLLATNLAVNALSLAYQGPVNLISNALELNNAIANSQSPTGAPQCHLLVVGILLSALTLLDMPSYVSPWQAVVFLLSCLTLSSSRSWNTCITASQSLGTFSSAQRRSWIASTWSELTDASKMATNFFQQSSAAANILLLSTTAIWLASFQANFRTPDTRMVAHLDTTYTASSRFEVVISMYDEPPEFIHSTMVHLRRIPAIAANRPTLTVYTKNQDVDLHQLASQTGATEVHRLPNRGREGETYLHHILENWDRLARHTLFIQAHVHNQRELFPRIRDYFVDDTGMLSLGFAGLTCQCDLCGDRWGWVDHTGIISRTYELVYGRSCSQSRVSLAYKGQFIASAARIRGISKDIYRDLHTALIDEGSWAHQEPFLEGRPDSLDAPALGFTLERLWAILMQCDDARIASMCPTLISGKRRRGNVRDCQCLDPNDNGMGDVAFDKRR